MCGTRSDRDSLGEGCNERRRGRGCVLMGRLEMEMEPADLQPSLLLPPFTNIDCAAGLN